MENRMLSDEILLGIINSKSGGGGGGGTSNYNDLYNQPQINGNTLIGDKAASDLGLATESALADKADKSAVKNEFLGTLDEWNALTAEQKKAYDTYQITDDYSEGGSGLPDYSTTEQKTGQKWIDDKDVYRKVISFQNDLTVSNSSWTSTSEAISNISTLISVQGVYDDACYPLMGSFDNSGVLSLIACRATSSVDVKQIIVDYTKTT